MDKNDTIISDQWLKNNLNNPEIIIIDCRFRLDNPSWGYQEYLNSHIQGAYYLNLDNDLSSAVGKHGGRHPLPSIETFTEKLQKIGINLNTLVVVYDDSRLPTAARLWFLLRYLGHQKVALLDGGFSGWLANNYPVDNTIPTPAKLSNFSPNPQPHLLVDINTVKACKDLPNVVLIDSRDRDRYLGEREPIDPIPGHIPGAINSPWTQVIDSQGFIKPIPELLALWDNYQSSAEMIVYCGSGVTACANLLSLQLAGFSNVKLYPGGWSDWCSYLI